MTSIADYSAITVAWDNKGLKRRYEKAINAFDKAHKLELDLTFEAPLS